MPGKRGEVQSNIELWFLLGAFLIAAFAGFGLLEETSKRVDGSRLEENFIARDLALTIDALYAAPGDVAYTYNLGNFRYYIDIAAGKVIVKKDRVEKVPVYYEFAGVQEKKAELVSPDNPSGLKFLPFDYVTINIRDENCGKGSNLILSKKNHGDGSVEIKVEGKNIVICNQEDEACSEKGVACE